MNLNVDADPLVRLLFQQAGWSADYRYDISAWSEALTGAGYSLWDEARLLLTRIGGLSIETKSYGEKPFWMEDDNDESYECILDMRETPGPLIFNPLHPMALAHREDIYRLKTLQETNWDIIPIGNFRRAGNPRAEYVLFLLSNGEIVEWLIRPGLVEFRFKPVGRTFSAAMRELFHSGAWFRGIMP